ncbi:AraC family transcriptional regulator [Maricaulis sp.]|uniref:AraC family transcriptional regulator n=1 Tax=Maricaulis sp. TaxID=1486257 RepID=UPI002B2754E3|nr:AraC family transcriptional regulator [Maricaulis sp.]
MTAPEIIEILARGGTVGLSLILGLLFVREARASLAARLGIVFAVGVAAYALVSSNTISDALGILNPVLNLLAIPTAVFFWWFATALFDDAFRWHHWRMIPIGLVALAAGLHFMTSPGSALSVGAALAWQVVNIAMMAHVVVQAIRDWPGDLIAPRRWCRIAFAGLIACAGMTISVLEARYAANGLPDWVFHGHGYVLFALALLFAGWLVTAPAQLFQTCTPSPAGSATPDGVSPEDRPLARRLEQAMKDGHYREPGLTVGSLASHLNTREHRLRRLINQGLGFRNFAAFLNSHRLADARRLLADPDRAHDQVLTIALDLGYGSIAPFNRAFRAETGTTPTLYRRTALSRL